MSLPASHFDRNPRLPDRRAHFRQPVRSLAYVELGDGNGGIALNISEGGMAVQAVMSLGGDDLPSVRVQLSHSKKQIQVKGRVAWTGDLRKLAGVEFVDVTEETRKQIREWIALENPEEERFEAPSEEVAEVTDPRPEEVDAALAATQAASVREFEGTAHVSEEAAPVSAEPSRQAPPVEFPSRPRVAVTPAAAVPPAFVPKAVQVDAADVAAAREPASTSPVPVDSAIEQVRVQTPETPKIPPHPSPSRTPRTSSFFFAASASSSAPAAPAAPRDPTPVPDDRFGFKRAPQLSQPDALLNAAPAASTEKWKISTWVPIFVVVALAAGWIAGRSVWRAGGPEPTADVSNPVAATETTNDTIPSGSTAPAQIEVLDMNGHRWLIPMQTGPAQTGAGRAPDTKVADSGAVPVPQAAMNLAAPAFASPQQPKTSSDASKLTPPPVSSPTAAPNNVLPSGSATETRNIVPPPDTNSSTTDGLQPGELIHKVEPEYPAGALAQKVEGTVKILAVIDTAGNVKSAQPLSGPRMLIPAALNAVRQWKYTPTLLHNQAIETQRQVTIVFEVSKNP